MAAMLILVAICTAGVAFLLYVLVALSREIDFRHAGLETKQRTRIVVPLPSDPIVTMERIRPAGVPENAPFTTSALSQWWYIASAVRDNRPKDKQPSRPL
jgi:hypothetical protein